MSCFSPSPLAQNVGSLMQNVGFVSVDFFIHLCRLISYAGSYQGPIGALLIIACIYYSLVYVEISVVSAIEIGLEWAWPVLHIWLRSLESVLKTAVAAVQGVDNLGESLMCDLASHWCSQFNLMCQHRCSFTTKTLDNFRYR
ncbi:hypothetical protein DdX_06661 [Ditylenchus destructor]|uniref:Uncharacterized protein n=1 Tax=Ditylenchus destructor TaxID=166010 RepID=A0AAD4N5Y7_9BILA|nr:hypothetical protein DdX_06661 [Ditylenchus destructor]